MDEESQQPSPAPAWCVVANVVYERTYGEQHEVRTGSKHFAPGTKIFCIAIRDDNENSGAWVVGRHRKSKRYISVWMRVKHLANWRVELVYSPTVIRRLTDYAYSTQITRLDDNAVPDEDGVCCACGGTHGPPYFDVKRTYYTWDGGPESRQKAEYIVTSPVVTRYGAGTQPFLTRQ